MEIAVKNKQGETVSQMELASEVFGKDFNEGLIHQVVTSYLANGRPGNKAQKSRSLVKGGGIKPWRQKGTGRARSGTLRSPIWRSGGVTFAATPRSYQQKINKKTYRAALRSILSELLRQDRLLVLDALDLDAPRTKLLKQTLSALDSGDALVLLETQNINVELASRNIPTVAVNYSASIDPVSLVSAEKVVMTQAALSQLQERFS